MGNSNANQPCYCGSEKKFKKCCRYKMLGVPIAVLEQYANHMQQRRLSQDSWEQTFGKVKPFISDVDGAGFRHVAVGSTVLTSPGPGGWGTPGDFLTDYLGYVIDPEWGNSELDKPSESKHILARWRDSSREEHGKGKVVEGLVHTVPTGESAAYLNIAYDLYLIGHNSAIQQDVIKRLKMPDQFQGAYYELTVAAAMMRAGFDLEYEDETDSTRPHQEFQAKHRQTHQFLTVEAKSRHRHGILGRNDPNQTDPFKKIGIRNVLKGALNKPAIYPSVVFIDLNLPTISEDDWEKQYKPMLFEEIEAELSRPTAHRPNIIFFTNISHHYNDNGVPGYRYLIHYSTLKSPSFELDSIAYAKEIMAGFSTYGHIPNSF